MKILKDVFYTEEEVASKVLDVYLPEGDPDAVFLYMHGGGLVAEDKDNAGALIGGYLAAHNIAFVTINYSMYPNAQYPDYINDSAKAVAWVHSHMQDLFHCDKLYVGGSSAGGYLSMMLCFDGSFLAGVGLDNSVITGYFHDAGQPTAHFNVLKYRGIDPKRVIVDETAPLYHVGLAPAYPRMRFIVSDNDVRGRYEQTMLMLATLERFGHQNFDHRVMEGKHCQYIKKLDENGESVFGAMIYDFIMNP